MKRARTGRWEGETGYNRWPPITPCFLALPTMWSWSPPAFEPDGKSTYATCQPSCIFPGIPASGRDTTDTRRVVLCEQVWQEGNNAAESKQRVSGKAGQDGWVKTMLGFSFSFSSIWHRSARKGPYALRPVSQQSPQGCPRNSANVCLVEHRSFTTLEGGMSAASFLGTCDDLLANIPLCWPSG